MQGIGHRRRHPRRDAAPGRGQRADPIALERVDHVVVTTLVDNVYDALLTGDNTVTWLSRTAPTG